MLIAGGRTGTPISSQLVRIVPPSRYLSPSSPRGTDRGLIAHYEFEGDLRDSGGTFGPGSGRGEVRYSAGRYGQAVSCNGTNTIVRLPNAANWRSLTISVHGRPLSPTQSSFLVNGWDVTREHFHISYGPRAGISVYTGGNHPQVGTTVYPEVHAVSTRSASVNAWTNIVLVADADFVVLYEDGVEVARQGQGGPSGVAPDIATGIELCGSSRNNNQYFFGLIDDLRIYNRALSAAEVAALR
jgi:hypothetical protein